MTLPPETFASEKVSTEQQRIAALASRSLFPLFSVVIVSAFLGEALVMWLLHYYVHLPVWQEIFLDAFLVALLIAPPLYFNLLRPLREDVQALQRMLVILRNTEEEQYRAMIRYALDGFWIADASGHFLEVNEAYCHLIGYSRDELLTMRITDVEVSETPDEVAAHIRKVVEQGGDHFETRHRCKDGHVVNVEVSVNFSPQHGGRFYCFLLDITRRKQAEEELLLNAQLLNATSDTVFLLDMNGKFVYLNEAAWKTRGYSREEMMAMNLRDLNAPEFNPLVAPRFKELMEKGEAFFESAHRCKDGTVMPVEINARLIESDGHQFALSVIRDITERKHAEQELRDSQARLKEMFENLRSGVAVYRTDDEGLTFVFSAFNRAAEQIENISRKDVLGRNVTEIFPGIEAFGLLEVIRRVWLSGEPEHFPASFYQDDRVSGWRDNYVYRLPSGEIVAIYDDVTKEKQAEEKMRFLAHHDALTALPNRTLLLDRLNQALTLTRRDPTRHLALMFMDLDRFKPVNDNYGHAVGDELLKEVAQRIQECLRESDTVSRLGGDEFVVLLPSLSNVLDAERVAGKILQAVSQPYHIGGHVLSISVSIGLAFCPEHGNDEKTLFRHADAAMYHAKSSGRNNVMLFNPGMSKTNS